MKKRYGAKYQAGLICILCFVENFLCPWKEEDHMSPRAVSPLATEIFHLESSSGPITAE